MSKSQNRILNSTSVDKFWRPTINQKR